MAVRAKTISETGADVAAAKAAGADVHTGELPRENAQQLAVVQENAGDALAAPANGVAALDDTDPGTALAAPSKVVARRQVTIPVVKWEAGQQLVFKPVAAIELGKEMTTGAGGKPKMERAHIMRVQGVTGALRVIIVNAVLKSELEEAYPNQGTADKPLWGYVGAWFAARKFAPDTAKDKRYATYQIIEIDDPTKE